MRKHLSLLALAASAQAVAPYSHYNFNETSGTVLHDTGSRGSVGNGTLLGYEGETSWTTVDGRQVLAFNGSSTYVQALVGLPESSPAFTISATVKFTELTEWGTVVKSWMGPFHFGLDNTNGHLSNYINTPALSGVVSADVVPVGEWLTLVLNYDGTSSGSKTQRLYINGTLVASSFVSGAYTSSTPYMTFGVKGLEDGSGVAGPPGWLKGYIDDVSFFTTQYSPADVPAVPESSTYGLCLGGLALAAAALARRRR